MGPTALPNAFDPAFHGADVGSQLADLPHARTCSCPPNHLNCMSAKEWIKAQLGVWEFYYEGRDVRDKDVHPAVWPIALPARLIELFTHEGELVLDPFAGVGTALVAARDLRRNAVGFDLNEAYVDVARTRLAQTRLPGGTETTQLAIADDAQNIPEYVPEGAVKLVLTSPPYANTLNRRRKNKSRRGDLRANKQYLRVEQYSQRPEDLGTMSLAAYGKAMGAVFRGLKPLLADDGNVVVNVPDIWWEDGRITLHVTVIESLRKAGYELRNTIIWDRRNVVNRIGIFGWPSNYITMGTTFEYLLHFRPDASGGP